MTIQDDVALLMADWLRGLKWVNNTYSTGLEKSALLLARQHAEIKRLTDERDALRAELDAAKARSAVPRQIGKIDLNSHQHPTPTGLTAMKFKYATDAKIARMLLETGWKYGAIARVDGVMVLCSASNRKPWRTQYIEASRDSDTYYKLEYVKLADLVREHEAP